MGAEPHPLDEVAALRLVLEGAVSETGAAFYRALVRNLARALGTAGAWVTEYLPEQQRLRSMAMWMNGAAVEHYEYNIVGTACEWVVKKRDLVHIPDRVIELFPQDADLVPLQAVSYLGAPLLDVDGSVMGHVAVLDTKRMEADPKVISLFEIFAARAAGELRRLRADADRQAREEQLSRLLESAMDAIVVLDDTRRIVRVNPAAERMFGCSSEDLVGEKIADFLVQDSWQRLEAFSREIATRPAGRQQLWVPQDFVARRWDHTVFSAEVTLSRFQNRGHTFDTLILRNADERLEAERQIQLLTQEAEYLRDAVRDIPGHGDLLGRSDGMRAVFEAIQRVAKTDSTVLITGETGTGKELVARSIYRESLRADNPLVLVNCAAIPANLIESELFGHERGAFTGAVTKRTGRFALAHGGTIFLDEVGELPLELQAKLLRVLQEGEFEPLGSTKTVKVDVRVIAATNRNLKQMVSDAKFREDLYFRLNVFPVEIPPLRARGRDVEHLAAAFAQRYARRMGKRVGPLTEEQMSQLRAYDWPGNVRELQNVIERAMILAAGDKLDLERAMAGFATVVNAASQPGFPAGHEPKPSERVLTVGQMEELERANIRRALAAAGGKISGPNGAARLIGIPPSTLSSRLKALRIQRS